MQKPKENNSMLAYGVFEGAAIEPELGKAKATVICVYKPTKRNLFSVDKLLL